MTVLIVGGGPAGAATALLLARYGVEVLLVERGATPDRVFRGEGLLRLRVDGVVMPKGRSREPVAGDWLAAAVRAAPACIAAACRAVQDEREPEIVRAQRLQRRESHGRGDARSGGLRYILARHGARFLGERSWAQAAWLRRQHDLRFGSRPVHLRLPPPA